MLTRFLRKLEVRPVRLPGAAVRFSLSLFCTWGLSPGANAEEADPSRWSTNQLAGTGTQPLPYQGGDAFPGLPMNRPVDLDHFQPPEGEALWLLTELGGKIWSFADTSAPREKALLLDLAETPEKEGQKISYRFYSIELHPDLTKNPWLFVSLNERANGTGMNRILRYSLSETAPLTIDAASRLELLAWESAGHDGCDLKFGPDGYLYISTGDGEPPGDPANVGQKTDNRLGSILRIDVSGAAGASEAGFQVPSDNPFLDSEGVPPDVWAYGLRNPWRINFHPETGELFLGDNGDEHWELVRRVTAGSNHGWSAYEGSHPFRLSNPLSGPTPELTIPVWEHPHTEMRSVIGGLFYQGSEFPDLKGHYVYGCYFTRKLWALKWDSAAQKATKVRRIADLGHQVVSFSSDDSGEILIVTHDGPVYRLERATPKPFLPVPETLSATGLFSNTEALTPEDGVRPYRLNASAWADGAEVKHHFAVPPGVGIQARRGEVQKKSWDFPNGSAFARTLTQSSAEHPDQTVRLETQVMHRDREEWRFLTYRWREDQSDADLVPESGATALYQVGDDTLSHRFASRGECTACHTQRSFFLLGLSTEQLNRDDQIDRFIRDGLFRKGQEPRVDFAPALADLSDEEAPLAEKARAYLHVNCAHCHRETGLGGRAEFQLLHWLSLKDTRAVGIRPLVGLPGIGDNGRVIAPGQPDHSEILRRMTIRGPNQMPLIGSDQVDHEGVALIREWISSLPADTLPVE